MKKIIVLLLIIVLASCKTSAPVEDLPSEIFFIPEPMPLLFIPNDAGGRSENPEDETGLIRDAFREAYAEALLRGINLTGVLGSDRVSPWPEAAPLSWSQNWANAERGPNSWGIDNLVLALGDYEALAGLSGIAGKENSYARVFTVSGAILDIYGKSAGYNRANGVIGYGIPLGDAFFSGGAAVQRFSKGRIIAAREGSRFSYEDDLFFSMIENLEEEEMETEFYGKTIPPEASSAFIYAWAFAFSGRNAASDGPIEKIAFPRPWLIETGGGSFSVKGFYFKSYNKSLDILVLIEADGLPLRVHHLYGPFLQAILANKRLPGLDTERKFGTAAGKGLGRSLAEGFAVYGPPLSNTLPMPSAKVRSLANPDAVATVGADDNGEPLFYEAQRFARGWIAAKYSERDTAFDAEPEED